VKNQTELLKERIRIKLKNGLLDPHKPVFKDDLVDDLAAYDAPPSKKMLAISIKFFVNHDSSAPIAPHDILLLAGMDPESRFFLPALNERTFPFHDPRLSCLHRIDITKNRGRINKVNPVFLLEKYCIFSPAPPLKIKDGFTFLSPSLIFEPFAFKLNLTIISSSVPPQLKFQSRRLPNSRRCPEPCSIRYRNPSG
jgi:hypothetical protein